MNNKDFKTNETERLMEEGFASVTVDNWNNYVQYVQKIEEEV
jgi:hypothetical protein